MPNRHQITAAVLTGPHQIPAVFLLRTGRRSPFVRDATTGPDAPHHGIGLDPTPGRTLQFRRRGTR